MQPKKNAIEVYMTQITTDLMNINLNKPLVKKNLETSKNSFYKRQIKVLNAVRRGSEATSVQGKSTTNSSLLPASLAAKLQGLRSNK